MGFGEGLLKDIFAFLRLIIVLCLRGENCVQKAHFYKQKGPCLKTPLNWTRSVQTLLIFLPLNYLGISGLYSYRDSEPRAPKFLETIQSFTPGARLQTPFKNY